jgi:hypothetical protein
MLRSRVRENAVGNPPIYIGGYKFKPRKPDNWLPGFLLQ